VSQKLNQKCRRILTNYETFETWLGMALSTVSAADSGVAELSSGCGRAVQKPMEGSDQLGCIRMTCRPIEARRSGIARREVNAGRGNRPCLRNDRRRNRIDGESMFATLDPNLLIAWEVEAR
jgi:hypothetical protein